MHWGEIIRGLPFTAANDRSAPAPRSASEVSPAARAMLALLGEAERRVLAWLPADGSPRGGASRDMVHALVRLRDLGLCGRTFQAGRRGALWHATRQGIMVRAALDMPGAGTVPPPGEARRGAAEHAAPRASRGALRRAAQDVLAAWQGQQGGEGLSGHLEQAMSHLRALLGGDPDRRDGTRRGRSTAGHSTMTLRKGLPRTLISSQNAAAGLPLPLEPANAPGLAP